MSDPVVDPHTLADWLKAIGVFVATIVASLALIIPIVKAKMTELIQEQQKPMKNAHKNFVTTAYCKDHQQTCIVLVGEKIDTLSRDVRALKDEMKTFQKESSKDRQELNKELSAIRTTVTNWIDFTKDKIGL